MPTIALPRPATRHAPATRRLVALCDARGSDVLLAAGLLALALVLLTHLPTAFDVDSWLELVAGRWLWQHGLPHHDTLTLLTYGYAWIDQQWLAQLIAYGVEQLGGLGLLGLVNVALMVGAVAISVREARRCGGGAVVVLAVLGLCAAMILPSREVRTEAFALPLFAVLAVLLGRDARHPSRRVYLCLPILVLWANLHGSVTLGVALVALRGLTLAVERRHDLGWGREAWRHWRRPLTLVIGAGICLLATPYGPATAGYYHATLLASTLHSVSEWQPITSSIPVAAAFFLLAGIALWSFGRAPTRTTVWERITVVILMAASVDAIRNAVFFALFALIVVPVSLGSFERRGAARAMCGRVQINLSLLLGGLLAVLLTSVWTLARPASTLELSYQRTGVLQAVQRATAADPSLRIFAEDRFADWLLWRDPSLAGRVAVDVRFELLTPAQMVSMNRLFGAVGTDWDRAARGYRLIVLSRDEAPDAVHALAAEPGSRVLYDDGERVVILRSAQEAA